MVRVLIAVGVVVVALVVAAVLRRRQSVAAPTRDGYPVPAQLDRNDFAGLAGPAPWLLVVFSSSTCATCADVIRKAEVLRSAQVGIADVDYHAHRDLHAKYAVEAVPMVLVADSQGVVRTSVVGPVTATDLWAAVAEVRQPGSTPSGIAGHCQTERSHSARE